MPKKKTTEQDKNYFKVYAKRNRQRLNEQRALWAWKKRVGEKLYMIKKHNDALTRLLRGIKRPPKIKHIDNESEN